MSEAWTRDVAAYLFRDGVCPRCDTGVITDGRCDNCGAALDGEVAAQLRQASQEAVQALRRRDALVSQLLTVPAPVVAPATPLPVAPVPVAVSAGPTTAVPPGSSASVQSVLALAGVGLVAVAAIVFTFLNPDLTDFRTRTLVVGVITLVFLGAAWLLARRRLRFSAEALAALAVVFLALDVWAFSQIAAAGTTALLSAAGATSASALGMTALGTLARIRSWLWSGLVGAVLAAVLFGLTAGPGWGTTIGLLAAAAVAIAAHDLIRIVAPRFSDPLTTERTTMTIATILTGALALISSVLLGYYGPLDWFVSVSIVLLASAGLSVAAARTQLRSMWSYFAGLFAATAIMILPFVLPNGGGIWATALVPAAAGVVLVLLGLVRRPGPVGHDLMLGGALTVLVLASLPAVVAAMSAIARTDDTDAQPATTGVAAVAAALIAAALARGRATRWGRSVLTTGSVYAALAVVSLPAWAEWPVAAGVGLAVALALAIALVLTRVGVVRRWPLAWRLPFGVATHVLVVLAAASAWGDSRITVLGGAAAVAVLQPVSRLLPRAFSPFYLGAGYAYALVLIATGLTHLGLEPIAVLCLVTTAGVAVALAATLTPLLRVRSWYTVLAVTAVPFLLGVGSVIAVRSGWTALSTFVTFLLALTLLLTRRAGLTVPLRTVAASILLPSLAVVVVCLSAQFLEVSGSPAALIVIAVLVALTLPSLGRLRARLAAQQPTAASARPAALAVEVSALVTAAIAVVLAIVREASGLPVALTVLLILAAGSAAAALLSPRRYDWPLAGAALAGALWCALGIAQVAVVEAYVLPPALGLAVVAAFLVARGRPAVALYAIGLGVATLTSVTVLAVLGGTARLVALGAGAVALVALGTLLTRRAEAPVVRRLASLRIPTLWAGIVATAAAGVAAVRLGRQLDVVLPAFDRMAPVLVLSTAAAVLAGWAAHELSRGIRSRWLYVPAALLLVVGPISAVHEGWFSILTLLALMLVLLAVMLITVVRAGSRSVSLPPVWLTFLLAWCTGVASWSERELRVEAFSLPLGLALLLAGVIAMRQRRDLIPASSVSGLTRWPTGFSGSWRLLAPGIVVVFAASVASTGTDPQTWRAVLVIGLALVAILLGSLLRLAAPFVLGIIVLPIENIVVFAVQLGRSIGALPWWITLATAGAVLLVIAVTSERRTAGGGGVVARLRDLA